MADKYQMEIVESESGGRCTVILTSKDLEEIKRSISKIRPNVKSIDWVGNDYDIYSALCNMEGWHRGCAKYVALAAKITPDLIETLEEVWRNQSSDSGRQIPDGESQQ